MARLQASLLSRFFIAGGTGYFPLAVGNWWEYDVKYTAADNLPTPANQLHSCVPNPFNPQTTISFDLPQATEAALHVFDLSGRLVRTLLSGEVAGQGHHEVVWNGCDDSGKQVSSGVYLYRLNAGDFSEARRVVLIK